MSTKKTFESFLNSMNENVDLYKVYKRVSGKYSLRKPSYWGDLFNQRASIPLKELSKYSSELDSLEVYTTKELGCHPDYPMQSNFKVQVPQVFVLYCNTERGELGEYYGMSILVNTEGATYPRYACGMPDFEPELHNFANGIPESYLNIVTTGAQMLHEKMIAEGQFSWMTQDTGDQIGSEPQNKIDVYMYDNQGNSWKERDYEGYGEFGGMDYYDLVATMNGYTEEDVKTMKGSFKELRQLGIDLAFGKIKTKDKKRKTLFPALVTDPRYNWKRHDFTQEAESDPNQSWYQEPEYDDYEDEYDGYESVVTEAKGDLKVGDKGIDYNDNVVKIIAIGNFKKIAKMFKKEMKADAADWGYEEGAGDFYLTKNIEATEGNVGDLAIYPVKYDMANYWGLDPLKESLVSESKIRVHSWFGQKKEFKDWLKTHKVEIESAEGEDGKDAIELVLTGKTKDLKKVLKSDHKFGWDDKQMWAYIEESKVNEGRSINKISKEHSAVVLDMSNTVKEWKEAEGDRKSDLLEKLRGLNKRKAELEKELDQAVAGKDSEVELALSESRELMKIDSYLNTKDEEVLIDFLDDAYGNSDDRKTRKEWEDARKDLGYNELVDYAVAHAENYGMDLQDIQDAIEVYEAKTINEKDDAGTHLDNLADLVGNARDFFAIGKELDKGGYKGRYFYSDTMMPMYQVEIDGFKFGIINKRYVDKGDREVGSTAIGLMEAVDLKKKVEALNEGLRNDLKKFIKKNQKELDRLADLEEWERLYLMLYTEFDVEPESDEAKEVKDAFDLTY